MTKHGVGVFSEALRREVTARHVRSSLVESGATESELVSHVREEIRDQLPPSAGEILRAEDIADAILYIVTRPRHVAINEVLVRPTEQVRFRATPRRVPQPGRRQRPRCTQELAMRWQASRSRFQSEHRFLGRGALLHPRGASLVTGRPGLMRRTSATAAVLWSWASKPTARSPRSPRPPAMRASDARDVGREWFA
jgi:hypothetical protein